MGTPRAWPSDTRVLARGKAMRLQGQPNFKVKVLDFVKSGGPFFTIDRTVFENVAESGPPAKASCCATTIGEAGHPVRHC